MTSSRLQSRPSDALVKRAQLMVRVLRRLFPTAGMALNYSTPYELLFAVMLSAQCTDKKVNQVTAVLFKKYPRLVDYVNADLHELEQDVHATGFFRQKAKNIQATARILFERYHGKLPKVMQELTALPGVGRKTANVVLGNAYGIVEGIAVDTHVRRIAKKYGLTKHTDVKKIEQDLMKLLPQKDWFECTYLMIEYGRHFCPAHKHNHEACPVTVEFKKAGYKL